MSYVPTRRPLIPWHVRLGRKPPYRRTLGSGKFLNGRPNGVFLSALTDSIGFLANPGESRRNNVPPLRPALVQVIAVRELVFWA